VSAQIREDFDDLPSQDVRVWNVVRFLGTFISEPEDIETGLVAVLEVYSSAGREERTFLTWAFEPRDSYTRCARNIPRWRPAAGLLLSTPPPYRLQPVPRRLEHPRPSQPARQHEARLGDFNVPIVGDGSHLKTLTRLAKVQLLILDDLLISPLSDPERKDLLEIIEDRHGQSTTVITSQYPTKEWHHLIGEPTIADAICDRLLHHSYKIELKGESIRKTKK